MKLFDKTLEIFYKENKDTISLSKKQFLDKYNDFKNEDLGFILSMENDIKPIFDLIKTFIDNCDLEIKEGADSLVYLMLCTLAATFDEPKETYRRLFSELRLRNLYGYLIDITNIFKQLHVLYEYHFDKKDIKETFSNKDFKKILKYLTEFVKENDILAEDIMEAMKDGWQANGVIKEDIDIKKMLDYIFDKANIESDFLDNMEDSDAILKWDEWKAKYGEKVDRIDES